MDLALSDRQDDEEISFVTESLGSDPGQPLRNTMKATPPPAQASWQQQRPQWSSYDPFAGINSPLKTPTTAAATAVRPNTATTKMTSLLDDAVAQEDETSLLQQPPPLALHDMVPPTQLGATQKLEEFLEMEDDDDESAAATTAVVFQQQISPFRPPQQEQQTPATKTPPNNHHHHTTTPAASGEYPSSSSARKDPHQPITTSSGLLLTHRRTTATTTPPLRPNEHYMSSLPRNLHREGYYFEVEAPGGGAATSYKDHDDSSPYGRRHVLWNIWQRRRTVSSLVWMWLALSGLIFMVGSAVLWHHVSAADTIAASQQNVQTTAKQDENNADGTVKRIVLLPMDLEQQQQLMAMQQQQQQQHNSPNNNFPHRRLSEWQTAFDQWAKRHGKTYETAQEREYRLQVWMDNHHRTAAKNEQHGHCPLMQRPVFGNGNHFQDLTQQEFQAQYLNAQRKPRKLDSPHNVGTLGPHVPTRRHADVHHRIVQQMSNEFSNHVIRPHSQRSYNCKWYDVSCNLRWFIERYFFGYFGLGRTMEPAYDKDSYPNAIDWRSLGAVTDVRAQDNCGACWAITAVETLESAVYLATGELYTLSETEVILCNEDCKMCAGGWPENAFDYIMEHGGIPLQNDLAYEGEYLLMISNVLAGESDELSSSNINKYKYQVCPADGSKDDSKDSNDSKDNAKESYDDDYYAPYEFARYGGILAGYGYATDPCTCYTDGSGCSCDSQDENVAVRNVATYGPAVVCVDAADWQDYEGGILTSASGCSADFMDVNHCVQVVGYAFAETQDDRGSGDANSDSNDRGDRDLASGSADEDVAYDGYWIVRNQWSEYWGMNGYAYVAMGDNTCGILNDMIQVYTDD